LTHFTTGCDVISEASSIRVFVVEDLPAVREPLCLLLDGTAEECDAFAAAHGAAGVMV